ncbi:MAG: sodium:alanine symporter family protein [Candidatus Aminicenantes bacterium]|nr:sodium:alanine symporter family protein [Candidatus Aminicenantes bacterium]
MIKNLYEIIEQINSVVWDLPVIILLVGTGIFLTIRLKGLQIRKFGLATRYVFQGARRKDKSEKHSGDISPFQALTTEMGSIIGNGNIAGVATAIAIGGPGALFWMWLSAFFGMATKYAEVVLGVKFRVKAEDGTTAAGPMYYLKNGLRLPFLGGLFAFMLLVGNFFTSPLQQTNSIALVFQSKLGIPRYASAIVVTFVAWVVIIGGIKSIGRFAEKMVPLMVVVYVLGCLAVILSQASMFPHALKLIFVGAFTPTAAVGGFLGAAIRQTMRYGIARGVMSNEAGIGTAGVIHGAARVEEPSRQGLISLWAVFVDTMIICSLTGISIIITGQWSNGLTSTALTASAFDAALPEFGGFIVLFSSVLFGFTSLISGAYTGGQSCEFFLGSKTKKIYYWILCVMMFFGGIMKVEAVWSMGDIVNGLKIVANVIGLVGLSGVIYKVTKAFFDKISEEDRT